MDWKEEILANKFQVGVLGVGLLLLLFGGVQMMSASQGDEVVVIEPEEILEEEVVKTVVVDVAGEVKNPGVFRMDEGVRIADALAEAGGYTDEVDGDYVARYINQAEPVVDGQKIYIPSRNEETSYKVQETSEGSVGAVAGSSVININTASISELDELWGIGESRGVILLRIDHMGV